MNFKEQLEKDLDVFYNTSEFAEVHNINGKDIPALVEDEESTEKPRGYNNQMYEGVILSVITVSVKIKDMDGKPVRDGILNLDGKLYPIKKVVEDLGEYIITLEANES